MKEEIDELEIVCHETRRRIFSTVLNANSGHIGGSSSSTEMLVVLYFGGILRYDPDDPRHPGRDRVLVRGHLGPLRYSLFSLLGWVREEELLTYRTVNSRLQGHESMSEVPGVDITPSGMLGMVLSYGVGCAIALNEQGIPATTWVLLGDGEEQEGNISEAARHASNLGLNKLVCILDKNGKQLSQPTSSVDGATNIATLWKGYGWAVQEITDGNSIEEVLTALKTKRVLDKPTLVIAHTIKGKGLEGAEQHESGYHTISTCKKEVVINAIQEEEKAIESLGGPEKLKSVISKRISLVPKPKPVEKCMDDNFKINLAPLRTDVVENGLVDYLKRTVELFKDSSTRFYVLTADITVKKLAEACGFFEPHVRYIDVGIREQHLFAMAHGISVTDPVSRVLIAEGECFMFRAIDQLHAISQAKSKMIIFAADSGLCEARNGPTHQTTGQSGAALHMPGLKLLEPADEVDLVNCLNWAFTKYPCPIYLRLHSGIVQEIPVAGSERNLNAYTAYSPSKKPALVIVASGLPVGNAVKLAQSWDLNKKMGIKVINVINPKELGRSFVILLEENVPVITLYNGSASVLQAAVAMAAMKYQFSRPSEINGHGFDLGTSDKLEVLIKHFRFDVRGLEEVIRHTLADPQV